MCTETQSHISSYKASTPDEWTAGDRKLISHRMESLKTLSISSLRPKENDWEMGQKKPWVHVPPTRLGNCSGWNLTCWGRRKEQFLAKAAPWRRSRHVHVSAGIAIWKNLGRCALRQAVLPLLMSASTHISLSGLRIHTLCNSEQVSIDGFLFWHRGCRFPNSALLSKLV